MTFWVIWTIGKLTTKDDSRVPTSRDVNLILSLLAWCPYQTRVVFFQHDNLWSLGQDFIRWGGSQSQQHLIASASIEATRLFWSPSTYFIKFTSLIKRSYIFSLKRPNGPIQSISWDVRCLSVCLTAVSSSICYDEAVSKRHANKIYIYTVIWLNLDLKGLITNYLDSRLECQIYFVDIKLLKCFFSSHI